MRVLHGADEGKEFVLSRQALALLPGAPAGANPKVLQPAGLAVGVAADGAPAVLVRWEDGGESSLPVEEVKRRSDEAPEAHEHAHGGGCGGG